jgi:uncharacterized protein (TIGR03437 family)
VAEIDPKEAPQLSAGGAVNAASYRLGPVAPGEVIANFGGGLGPIHGAAAGLVNGMFPNTLKDTTVYFDDIPAPLLYAQAGQINVNVATICRHRTCKKLIECVEQLQ